MKAQVGFDSGLYLVCVVGSGVSHLPLDPPMGRLQPPEQEKDTQRDIFTIN